MAVKKKTSTKANSSTRNVANLKSSLAESSSSMNDSTNIPTNTHLASPLKKQTAQGKMHSTKYDQVDDISLGYSSFELQAMLENFELDASSKLTALRKNQALRLEAMQRHWTTAVNSLDPRIRSLSLDRFYSEFNGDKEAALRAVVTTQLRREQGPMSQVEQSARKRKRTERKSPAHAFQDDDDVFQGPADSLSKKPRGLHSAIKLKGGDSAQRASRLRSTTVTGSPNGTARKPRLRLRPSTAATNQDTTSSSGNFVYRAGNFNPLLPATPSVHSSNQAGGRARQPRRGESIVLQSVNGSPLGEFVASDVEDNEAGEDEDWDLMDKNEASRAEDVAGAGKKKQAALARSLSTKGKAKAVPISSQSGKTITRKSSRSRSSSLTGPGVSAPTANSFAVALPADAPSYDELKEKVIAGMRADLEKRVMSDQERRVLVESLEAFARAGM